MITLMSGVNLCFLLLSLLQYFYIGCGGSTRDRAPDSVAAALNRNIAGDRQYNEAGVAETFSDLVMVRSRDRAHACLLLSPNCKKAHRFN